MEFQQLRYFLQLCEDKSFVTAAEHLYISQQALRKSVRKAEDELETLIADKDAAMQIHKLLHILEEPYKEVFMLRVFGELGFREIGEIFGKTAHWSCVTYQRAKARLIERMKEESK